ncbi:MAG: hypothetical protein V3R31_02145 [Candidatus Humimicrobiaceae bacterium]
MKDVRIILEKALEKGNGILNLRPAWVTRDFMPPGKRLGLKEEDYDAGERGYICERWFASVTHAENRINVEDEGYSYLDIEGENIHLKDACGVAGDLIMGAEYAKTHKDLDRLLKIYDFNCRIFYHLHQTAKDAKKVGMNSKEESYYFLEADPGPHPETFFGVHPYIVEKGLQNEIFLPYLKEWNGDDTMLAHARAYMNIPGEGFHLPCGLLHAPGTALTMELQESSDIMSVFQAKIGDLDIDKELLTRLLPEEEVARDGEMAALNVVDWEANGDPYFYENHHIVPVKIEETASPDGWEEWIYYNTTRFSGKRLTLKPGKTMNFKEKGVLNIFVWRGSASVDGKTVTAGDFGLGYCSDELLITHGKALEGFTIKNTGSCDLVLFKFFGPDINLDIPMLPKYSLK